MLSKYETKLLSDEEPEFNRESGYIFMLLGACAMSLGCTIPMRFRTTMQKVFMCVGMPADGIKQLDKALNGPIAYKNGEAYHFDSLGLIDTMNSMKMENKENMTPSPSPSPKFINVHGPGTMFYNPPMGSKKGLNELKAAFAEEKYGQDVCGGCGAKEGKDGADLLYCAKCKSRKYCGKDCQAEHWKFHKTVCKVSSSGKENVKS